MRIKWSAEKSYLVRFGGAGACFPFLLVGRRICTKLLLVVLSTGPPVNVLSLLTAPSDKQDVNHLILNTQDQFLFHHQ